MGNTKIARIDIYATSIDYDPRSDLTKKFFATVEKTEKEFEIYRDREMKQLESDFDKMVKMLKENNKDN